MRHVVIRQVLALAIAASIPFGISALGIGSRFGVEERAQAGVWNPLDWFHRDSGVSASNARLVEKARKNAERAQLQAEQVFREAMRAKEQAEKARKAADALSALQSSSPTTQPVAASGDTPTTAAASTPSDIDHPHADSPDNNEANGKKTEPEVTDADQTTGSASSQVESPQPLSHSSSEKPSKKALWNPSGWLNTEDSTQTPSDEPTKRENAKDDVSAKGRHPETSGSETSADGKSAGNSDTAPWNPLTWFGGSKHNKTAPSSQTSDTDTEAAANGKASRNEVFQTNALEESSAARPAVKAQAAVIETEKGSISIELYPDQAPLTVANFAKLINEGFYNKFNMRFHRVIPGFVIQTGDPTGTGAGGSKTPIPLEVKNKLSHNAKGVVAMARGSDPGSATSQFYITLAPQTVLDGKYAIFGKVIGGMDVLDKIEKGDMLYGVRLADIKTVTRDPQPEKKKFFSNLF